MSGQASSGLMGRDTGKLRPAARSRKKRLDNIEASTCVNLSPHTGAALLLVCAMVLYGRPQGVSGFLVVGLMIAMSVIALVRGALPGRPRVLPVVFVVLAALSAFWSDEPRATLMQAASSAIVLLVALQIARNVRFDRFLKISDWFLRIAVLTSVGLGFFLSDVGLTQREVNSGTLRGWYEHRNGMGFMVTLAIVTLLARAWTKRRPWATFFWLGVYVFALAWAGSAGALLLVCVGLLIYLSTRWIATTSSSQRGVFAMLLALLVVVFSVLAAPLLPVLVELLGRDLTFTNRTYIWEGAIDAWAQQFWLGYGWGNILDEGDAAASAISELAGYSVRSTHNGYLATALQLGVLGLAVSVLFLVSLLTGALRTALCRPSVQALWSLQIMVILILGDLVETRAFVNLGWLLICLVAAYAHKGEAASLDRFVADPSLPARASGATAKVGRRARLRRSAHRPIV